MDHIRKVFIGIDGSVSNCGLAVWVPQSRTQGYFQYMEKHGFWACHDRLMRMSYHYNLSNIQVTMVIEDITQNTLHPNKFPKAMPALQKLKAAQDIGMARAATRFIIEFAEGHKNIHEVIKIRPGKYSATKMKAEAFKNLTGYEGSTNEHNRDAGMLVFQRS